MNGSRLLGSLFRFFQAQFWRSSDHSLLPDQPDLCTGLGCVGRLLVAELSRMSTTLCDCFCQFQNLLSCASSFQATQPPGHGRSPYGWQDQFDAQMPAAQLPAAQPSSHCNVLLLNCVHQLYVIVALSSNGFQQCLTSIMTNGAPGQPGNTTRFSPWSNHLPPLRFALWLDEDTLARLVFLNSVDDALSYWVAAQYWRNLQIVLMLLQPERVRISEPGAPIEILLYLTVNLC